MRYLTVIFSAILFLSNFCSAKPVKQHNVGQGAVVSSSKPSASANKTASTSKASYSQRKNVSPKTPSKSPSGGLSLLSQLSSEVQNIFDKNKDAVVKVMSVGTEDNAPILYGTGFFIDARGYILTTATVAPPGNNLWVEFNDISYSAQLLGADPVTNLAVLELLKTPTQFQVIDLGKFDAYIASPIGEFVVAIGSTLGMSPSPRLGTITGNDLTYGDHVFIATYLRSSLEIFGGESGSPVFDSTGQLCGIMIASLPEIHSSFIIPRCMLSRIVEPLKNKRPVVYASAGFNVRGQVSANGVKEILVSSVMALKSAKENALTPGDIIISIDDSLISNEGDIANLLFFKHPENKITITIKSILSLSGSQRRTERKIISQKLGPKS